MNVRSDEPIYQVNDLVIDLYTENVSVRAVDRSSFALYPGETLCIVGESGSGKTVMTLGPLGLLPEGLSVDMRGEALWRGRNLLAESERRLSRLRGSEFGVVFQDPVSSLNPMRRIGPQLAGQASRLTGASSAKARQTALELLARTGIPDPEARYRCYPHEMSGGMLQRVMIALALVGNPRVLIADEPTTALDATVQAQILELIGDIQREQGIAVVLITHDISVVSSAADWVIVLYGGQVAESGPKMDVLTRPVHPYTRGLLASVPDLRSGSAEPIVGIPGSPPDQSRLRPGCRFAERCTDALDACFRHRPELQALPGGDAGHRFACPVELNRITGHV